MVKVELLFIMQFLGLKEAERDISSELTRKIRLNALNFYFKMALMWTIWIKRITLLFM